MEIKYYKCIKEPIRLENDINMFISYTFYGTNNGNSTNASYYQNNNPRLTLGCIYHTTYFSNDYIIDDSATSRKLIEVMQYLEPYELIIDKLTQKIIEKKKNDIIEIRPMRVYEDSTSYLITVSAFTKSGIIVTIQIYSDSIYDGLISCYKRLRTRNDNYCMFYSLIHNKIYPIIKRRGKKVKVT